VSSQPEAVKLAPELVDGVTTVARTLVAAVRHWTLYPENHPAVRSSFERLAAAIQGATSGSVFSLGITPDSLLIDAFPIPSTAQVVEAARLLHDRDLIRLTFCGMVPPEAVARLLRLLALDRETLRERGGPEGVWRVEGDESITIEQIDYEQVLEDREQQVERRHDDIWRSIVSSIVAGQKTMDEIAQQRLLAIAGDPDQISDLATAVIAHKCTPDGAPMITTQAATVLAAFRHLASIVSVKAADRSDETLRNLATAASTLNPHVVMEMLQSQDSPGDTIQIVHGLSAAFDDMKVAQLLATALANEGQASGRLAEVFNLRGVEAVQSHLVVDGRAADFLQRHAVRVAAVPLAARFGRRARRHDRHQGRSTRRTGEVDRKPGPGERPEAVGRAHHRSAQARARSGPCSGNRT
jgi:hypothetical protein